MRIGRIQITKGKYEFPHFNVGKYKFPHSNVGKYEVPIPLCGNHQYIRSDLKAHNYPRHYFRET